MIESICRCIVSNHMIDIPTKRHFFCVLCIHQTFNANTLFFGLRSRFTEFMHFFSQTVISFNVLLMGLSVTQL